MDLVPPLDVALERAEHSVELRLFLLVELAADPRQGRQHREGEPIPANLKHQSTFTGGLIYVVPIFKPSVANLRIFPSL